MKVLAPLRTLAHLRKYLCNCVLVHFRTCAHSRTHTLAYVRKSSLAHVLAQLALAHMRKNLRTYARTCALTQALAHVGLLAHLRSCAACTLYMSIDRTSSLAQDLGGLSVIFLNLGN